MPVQLNLCASRLPSSSHRSHHANRRCPPRHDSAAQRCLPCLSSSAAPGESFNRRPLSSLSGHALSSGESSILSFSHAPRTPPLGVREDALSTAQSAAGVAPRLCGHDHGVCPASGIVYYSGYVSISRLQTRGTSCGRSFYGRATLASLTVSPRTLTLSKSGLRLSAHSTQTKSAPFALRAILLLWLSLLAHIKRRRRRRLSFAG